MTDIRVSDAYMALRALGAGMTAAADQVLAEVREVAGQTGSNSFQTPFGKLYSSTYGAKVEILPSATLMEWVAENLLPEHAGAGGAAPIVAEHYEDQFDERQIEQAANRYAGLAKGRGVPTTGPPSSPRRSAGRRSSHLRRRRTPGTRSSSICPRSSAWSV